MHGTDHPGKGQWRGATVVLSYRTLPCMPSWPAAETGCGPGSGRRYYLSKGMPSNTILLAVKTNEETRKSYKAFVSFQSSESRCFMS